MSAEAGQYEGLLKEMGQHQPDLSGLQGQEWNSFCAILTALKVPMHLQETA